MTGSVLGALPGLSYHKRAAVSFAGPILALAINYNASAQRPDTSAVVDHALASGDGKTPSTAYAVPGLLWEYAVLDRLRLRFRTQRTAEAPTTDVITVRDPEVGQLRNVWFRAGRPEAPADAETDRIVRRIMTSGDGSAPETAFVVGGYIETEYKILRLMGINPGIQSLMTIRGCSFDMLSGDDLDTGERRNVYFKLGGPDLEYRGECTLQPPIPAVPGPMVTAPQ